MALIEESFNGTIKSPDEMLSLWLQVEGDIIEVGQSYNAPGGVEVTFADVDKVRRQINYWEKRALARRGSTGRNTLDIEAMHHNENSLPE